MTTDTLTVTGRVGDQVSTPNEVGLATLSLDEIPATVQVELVAPPSTTRATVTKDETVEPLPDLAWTVAATDTDAATLTADLTIDSEDDLGIYSFTVEGVAPAKLKLSVAQTLANNDKEGTPPKPQVVAETETGVYDADFAGWSGFLAFLVVGAIVAAVWGGAAHQTLPHRPISVAEGGWVSGTYAEQAAFILLLVAGGAAAVLLVVGAWLATMECRGRLSRRIKVKVPVAGDEAGEAGDRGPVAETGMAVKGIVDSLTLARGTIAVLCVAGIVMVAVVFAATVIAVNGDDGPHQVEPTASTTPSQATGAPESPGPSTTPAESSNDPSADAPTDTPT